MPKINGYLARDKDGSLDFYASLPTRILEEGIWLAGREDPDEISLHSGFPVGQKVEWEDEPMAICIMEIVT